MAKRKDTAAKSEITPASETPKLEATPKVEPPKLEMTSVELSKIEASKVETPKIELPKVESPAIDPLKAEVEAQLANDIPDEMPAKPTVAAMIARSRFRARHRRMALLAASVALAAIVGAVAGAGTTALLAHPKPVVDTAAATQTRALKDNVARLSGELWTVKASIENANKHSATQLNKLADRIDRAEKAQAEPAAKLAKIMESLDRLERRPQVAVASADVTGSVTTVEKQSAKPPMIEGWRLRDYYAGHAVLQNRSGDLYEVAAGANLPGAGKVESVKRDGGRVIITTPKGVIAANFEVRRGPYYPPPYRY